MKETHEFIARAKGAMLGLALGDALGTTLEFKPKDTYPPLIDMIGGGPFKLQAGQWTDDTSMMLCLADSLIDQNGHDADDQMSRYVGWWQHGDNSVTGHCFDIGSTVVTALKRYLETGEPNAGSRHNYSAGNGSLMRLAPVAIFYSRLRGFSESDLLHFAKASSITTHAERRAVEACQITAWLLDRILCAGATAPSKEGLFTELELRWQEEPLHPELAELVRGAFITKPRDDIRGTGYVVASLEAALWAFANSDNFEQGALLAANLGDDADTTAAIYGQIAGAYYGAQSLPQHWLDKLYWREEIEACAVELVMGAYQK